MMEITPWAPGLTRVIAIEMMCQAEYEIQLFDMKEFQNCQNFVLMFWTWFYDETLA